MYSKEELTVILNRHKTLLIKEIYESREMVRLLRKSTITNLTEVEKVKVKEQLADILKAIPAFSVFMLPGGALLLPLVLKVIPNLLPSSYRNYEEEE